jgi:predicted MPP superfamily phosphohydrolase
MAPKTSIRFGWLHLSDLHMGPHRELRDTWEESLFADLRLMHGSSGPWDAVLFTGDLVQAGLKEEFVALEGFLDRLWKLMKVLGSRPVLIPVPGNHDLIRPKPEPSATHVLTGLWHKRQCIRDDLWHPANGEEYRQVLRNAFGPYDAWAKRDPRVVAANPTWGQIPGDISVIFRKDGACIGIVGLSSSFLHLNDSVKEGGLDLDVRQLMAVCKPNLSEWVCRTQANFLLTHHPQSWLDQQRAFPEFRREIAPAGRFVIHLCGHLHDSNARVVAEGGSPAYRSFQSASLFGLDSWGEQQNRMHGYAAGALELSGNLPCSLRIWPRMMVPKQGGSHVFDRDLSYTLEPHTGSFELLTRPPASAYRGQSKGKNRPGLPPRRVVSPPDGSYSEPGLAISYLGINHVANARVVCHCAQNSSKYGERIGAPAYTLERNLLSNLGAQHASSEIPVDFATGEEPAGAWCNPGETLFIIDSPGNNPCARRILDR